MLMAGDEGFQWCNNPEAQVGEKEEVGQIFRLQRATGTVYSRLVYEDQGAYQEILLQ